MGGEGKKIQNKEAKCTVEDLNKIDLFILFLEAFNHNWRSHSSVLFVHILGLQAWSAA